MNKCKNIKLMISLHIDNKLSLEEVSMLMQHLETCQKCRQLYKDFKDIKSILSDQKHPFLSPNFTNSTMQKINVLKNGSIEDKTIYVFFKNHAAMAAGFIFVIAASLFFMTKQPSHINNSSMAKISSESLQTISDYCINYDNYTSLDEVYEDDIVSFLLVY